MDILKNAFGGDRPTEGNQERGERTHQVERSEQGRYDEGRSEQGRYDEGRNEHGRYDEGRSEQGGSGGGFLGGLSDKFGGGNQQGHRSDEGQRNEQGESGGGFLSGIGNKINSAAGGGKESEKNEDYLDKGVDYVQQYMGSGDQSNESAIEQAKDEQISDFIRAQYKSTTGKEFPVADKSR